jgi:hypothetical protein
LLFSDVHSFTWLVSLYRKPFWERAVFLITHHSKRSNSYHISHIWECSAFHDANIFKNCSFVFYPHIYHCVYSFFPFNQLIPKTQSPHFLILIFLILHL